MYVLSSEGLFVKAYTGVILLLIVLLINGLSTYLSNKLTRRMRLMDKIVIRNLDLYYDDLHALKNINMDIKERKLQPL